MIRTNHWIIAHPKIDQNGQNVTKNLQNASETKK